MRSTAASLSSGIVVSGGAAETDRLHRVASARSLASGHPRPGKRLYGLKLMMPRQAASRIAGPCSIWSTMTATLRGIRPARFHLRTVCRETPDTCAITFKFPACRSDQYCQVRHGKFSHFRYLSRIFNYLRVLSDDLRAGIIQCAINIMLSIAAFYRLRCWNWVTFWILGFRHRPRPRQCTTCGALSWGLPC